jgi:hypothetical protein
MKRLILPSTGFVAAVFAPATVMTPVVASACLQTVMTACARLSGGAMPRSIVGRGRIYCQYIDLILTGD